MHASIHTHVHTHADIHTHTNACIYMHVLAFTYRYIHVHTQHKCIIHTLQTYKHTYKHYAYQNINSINCDCNFSCDRAFFAYKRIHLPYELEPRQEQSDPFGQQVQGMPSQEGLDLCGHAYQNSTMWEQNNEKRRRSKLKSYIQFDPSLIICEGHMLFDRMESSVQAPLGTRKVLEWNTNL